MPWCIWLMAVRVFLTYTTFFLGSLYARTGASVWSLYPRVLSPLWNRGAAEDCRNRIFLAATLLVGMSLSLIAARWWCWWGAAGRMFVCRIAGESHASWRFYFLFFFFFARRRDNKQTLPKGPQAANTLGITRSLCYNSM